MGARGGLRARVKGKVLKDMEQEILDGFLKELDKVIKYDNQGMGQVKSNKDIITAVDNSVCRVYRQRLINLAYVAKEFIGVADKLIGRQDSSPLNEQLQSLEYAIAIAEKKND